MTHECSPISRRPIRLAACHPIITELSPPVCSVTHTRHRPQDYTVLVGGSMLFNIGSPASHNTEGQMQSPTLNHLLKDRKSFVSGKSVSVSVDHGGRRIIK